MPRVLKAGLAVVVVLAVLSLGIQAVYAHKALPNVEVGGLNVSGKSEADISQLVTERAPKQLKFTYQGTSFTVPADAIDLKYDATATGTAATTTDRDTWVGRFVSPLRSLVSGTSVTPVYQYNAAVLTERIKEQTERLSKPAVNANVTLSGDTFKITGERDGTGIEPRAGVIAAQDSLGTFSSDVTLVPTPQKPTITKRDLTPTRAYAELLAADPLKVTARDYATSVSPDTIRDWIGFRTVDNPTVPPVLRSSMISTLNDYWGIGKTGVIGSELNSQTLIAEPGREAVGQYVATVADQADSPPVNARLAFNAGQLQVTGAPKDGVVVNRPEAITTIQSALKDSNRTAALPVTAAQAEIREDTLPKLGITGLIGSATTHFPGSPVNRTYNIGVGAAKFDGVLIKPGEEFSFNKTLGDVGPETGYRQELVILENKTTPQYGGGLCQVSTTMFRAAMAAGLPITDRSNHSYAVHYYDPIGMDATIYPPDPDMKFINNTGHYILVQTHQSGTNLTYDFYGTSDGRQARTEILSQNATEANGGTASFRYVVEGGPDPINRVFSSTYLPHSKFPVVGSLN
jgi:vancomycin resistance protein YoaR